MVSVVCIHVFAMLYEYHYVCCPVPIWVALYWVSKPALVSCPGFSELTLITGNVLPGDLHWKSHLDLSRQSVSLRSWTRQANMLVDHGQYRVWQLITFWLMCAVWSYQVVLWVQSSGVQLISSDCQWLSSYWKWEWNNSTCREDAIVVKDWIKADNALPWVSPCNVYNNRLRLLNHWSKSLDDLLECSVEDANKSLSSVLRTELIITEGVM